MSLDDEAARARQRDLVRRGYDAISSAYRTDQGEPGRAAEDTGRYAEWVASLASLLRPGARVLDLGCAQPCTGTSRYYGTDMFWEHAGVDTA